jgi:CRP-like cAMP-binding protein
MLEDRFQERMLMLRSIPSFSAVDDPGLAYLAQRARQMEASPGDVLREQGQPSTHGWILLKGSVRTIRDGQLVNVVEAPGVLGLLSVAARDEGGVRAEVIAESQLLEVPIEATNELMESNFSFARNVLRNLSRHLLDVRGNLPARTDFERTRPPARWPDPMTWVDRLRSVRAHGVFADVNMEAAVDLARSTHAVRLETGQILWEAGDPPDVGFRVLHGQINCATEGGSVRVGDGFALGVLEMFADIPRQYRAQVVEEGRALRFDADVFLGVLEIHPGVLLELVAGFAQSSLERGR